MSAASRIRVLPDETVNRVAAGEVVERPAAALKELLENALDAGAGRVEVDLERAGTALIRVADDGHGMTHDDALLALERHATSKIAAVEDLGRIGTYGFRGEALPSIAAVSRMRLTTRARGEAEGTRVEVAGGRIARVAPCGCPEGTEVEVRDLFHTVPARLKFLRTDATELGHCVTVVARLALARPGLAIALRHGGRELLRLGAAPDAGARLRDHFGREFVAGLVPVAAAAGDVAVSGYVSRPGRGRPGAEYQQLFVNGRPVRDALLAQGLREAVRDTFAQDPAGMSYFLWITLPAAEVDVNVHPTKREVRFRDLGALRRLAGDAARAALRDDRLGWAPAAAKLPPPLPHPLDGIPPEAPRAVVDDGGFDALRAGEPPAAAAGGIGGAWSHGSSAAPALPLGDAAPVARPLAAAEGPGQLFGTYLVSILPDALVVTDQHAAHERVLYERVLARPSGAGSQQLLHPVLIELAAGEEEAAEAVREGLARVGVEVEPSGPRTWRVRALPPELPAAEAAGFFREALAVARSGAAAPAVEEFRARAAALIACHGSVRAKQRLSPGEAAALLADLARAENPAVCPHGRPTSIRIERSEIEKRFKRT